MVASTDWIYRVGHGGFTRRIDKGICRAADLLTVWGEWSAYPVQRDQFSDVALSSKQGHVLLAESASERA